MIEGRGLHGGAPGRVRLSSTPGPVRLRAWESHVEARIDELVMDGASRSTSVRTRDGRFRVNTVEHLFAALGGAAIHSGVVVEIEGPEIPLADGGASTFFDTLVRTVPRASVALGSSLVVARAATIDVGGSRYTFEPHDGVRLEVEVDFGDVRLERHASWDGDVTDFRERIASARTFGFEHEVQELLARGLARHVAPESVILITSDRILSAGRPFEADEPARHKLLDLVGDLYAHGGPALGSVRALRPGHAATHEAMRRAFLAGVFARTREHG